jgi:hypothetical protein
LIRSLRSFANLSRQPSPARASGMMTVSALACCLTACQPALVVGEWKCPEEDPDAAQQDIRDPIPVPWTSGFENRFCDYTQPGGFCYGGARASFHVVSSPVHSGDFAAAFTATGSDEAGAPEQRTRCARQGSLPEAAYYGAWYYVPVAASNGGIWNLFHFQGANGGNGVPHGLWDVSLTNAPSGQLRIRLYDFFRRDNIDGPVIPIGAWFHLELYLKRAKDASGEVVLYIDGEKGPSRTDVITDDTDWGQWHVGNYVTTLTPPDSTVYVDDITIATTH